MHYFDFRTFVLSVAYPAAIRVGLFLLLALAGSNGCGVAPDEMTSEPMQSQHSELVAGGPSLDPSGFGIVTIDVDPWVRRDHDWDFCLGTLVRNSWVLTTKGCVSGVAPSDLTIQMTSTHGGPTQTSAGLELYSHPQIDVGLIKLASPFLISGDRSSYVHPIGGSVPNHQWVRCFGRDWSGDWALRSKRFFVTNAGWNVYSIDDPDQSLETWDHGGPCVADGSTTFDSILGIVSSVGTRGVHALLASVRDTNWVEDMINLSHVADLNSHFGGNRIQSTFDSLCLDVADASVGPNVAVNQFTCHTGLNQKWYWTNPSQPWNETHLQSLVSVNSGKCLEVGPDWRLRQNSCTGAWNQTFGRSFNSNGYAIFNPSVIWFLPNTCADIPGASMTPGVRIQMGFCNLARTQGWRSN